MKNIKTITGYSIDFQTNTLTMNYKFSQAAKVYNSTEYKILQGIKKDFPEIKICVKSGREQKTPRYNSRLKYENMEAYIKCFDNAEILLQRFETVKTMSKVIKSPYKFVCDWFLDQFPDYKKTPKFEGNNITMITFVPYPNPDNYLKKVEHN